MVEIQFQALLYQGRLKRQEHRPGRQFSASFSLKRSLQASHRMPFLVGIFFPRTKIRKINLLTLPTP